MNTFADFFWAMIYFYFIFLILWIFIRIFIDLFHRTDLSGGWKVLWILVIFVVPFFGAIVYMISRPATAQTSAGQAPFQQAQVAPQAAVASSTNADEIAKLAALRDSGAITPAEFDAAKAKAMA